MFWGFWDHLRIFIELAHQLSLSADFWLRSSFFSVTRSWFSFCCSKQWFLKPASKFGAHQNLKPLRFSSLSSNPAAISSCFRCLFVFLPKVTRISLTFARKQALVLGRPGIRNLPISVVRRSGCRLLYKYEKSGGGEGRGKEQTLSKILAISQHAKQSWCWKSKRGQDALEQKGVAWPRKQMRTPKLLLS